MALKSFSSEFTSDVSLADHERFPELFRQGPMADRHQATRIVPMRVLVFGLMRTGTSSIRVALSRLGFDDIYHMTSVFYDQDDAQWWNRAMDAKWNNKGTFGLEDWDKLLGHCQAVCDVPPAAFAEELIAAYPEAKVVLLNRDVDKWYQSMTSTVLKAAFPDFWSKMRGFFDWKEQGQVAVMIGKMMRGMFGPGGTSENNMKRFYVDYHENLRHIVPRERLLEFKVQDGYKPLCDFLGVPVPTTVIGEKEIEEPFPRVNEGATFGDRMTVSRKLQNKRLLKKTARAVSIIATVGAGLWFLRR